MSTSSGDGASNSRTRRRIDVSFRVEYTGRNVRGHGVVKNLSLTGALVEQAEPTLIAGGSIVLQFSFFDESLPVEIPAKVVRETETGFAVHFGGLDRRVQQLLAVAISRAQGKLEKKPPGLGTALLSRSRSRRS